MKFQIIVQTTGLHNIQNQLSLINEKLYRRTLFKIVCTIIVTMATSVAKCSDKTKVLTAFTPNLCF